MDGVETQSFRAYGAQVIEERLEKMLSYIDAVRQAEDIEALHDMRVASRRLRAALSVFGPAFEGRGFRAFGREVRGVTDALGAARDLDVMIEELDNLALSLPEEQRSGIEAFAVRKRQSRGRRQNEILRAFERLERKGLPGRFARLASRTQAKAGTAHAHDAGAADSDAPVRANAGPVIGERLEAFLGWERYIHDPARVYELHQMRIAAKRLRYTLEVFAPFYGGELRQPIERVKAIQETLGSIHDADVLAPELGEHLRRMLSAWRRAAAKTPSGVYGVDLNAAAGLVAVCERKRDERDQLYRQFVEDWDALRACGFIGRLKELVKG